VGTQPPSSSSSRSLFRSKKGIAGVLLSAYAGYGLIHDFLDFLRDVAYTTKHADPVMDALGAALNFLTTGLGNLVAIIIATVLILWALRTEPRQVGSDNAVTAQTDGNEDAEEVKTKLDEARLEIERLRIELNNRPPRHFSTPVEVVETLTPAKAKEIEQQKSENEKLKRQLAEAQQTIQSQRQAMEDEQGVADWGEHNAGTIETVTPAKAKEIEELKAENERLRNEASSPEVAKQKRLCFHLAGQLRSLYEELLDGERLLDAQLQERREANVPEEELQRERRAKQLRLEGRIRQTYMHGFDDRLDKLYWSLQPDSWLGPNDQDLFGGNLPDPHDIKKVADRLDEVGRNLL